MYLEVVTGIVEDGGGWWDGAAEWRVYIPFSFLFFLECS